ncbi:MAG: MFS transporter, partial [Muribaculaceae bacterium]|nr:MFS transporter [Muribaculaceae bacterium]
FFGFSVILLLAAMGMLIGFDNQTVLYTAMGMIGFGNSNIFSIVFSQALLAAPDERNEVSGLMIMGLFGGTIFPLAMGYASDATGGQAGAVAVMLLGVAYLMFYTLKIKTAK